MAKTLTPRQAKNLAKSLRLARATTGHEQLKHYQEIDRMIKKYDLVIPDVDFDMKKETMKHVDEYREQHYKKIADKTGKRKIFYKHNELSGWRFYLKALLNIDMPSLIGHVKRVYFK